ncbi:hypothetical protein BCR35DRAFT_330093 [Leucosporidium creatinivorum]|uniref:F-box domain-containing protein n=1 Tax=Leucosporidium creatinivorum TaxID=106004 RepID=A0A1Y2FY12_9BASI|nr:hypothetical protein BCR35DRAFT_330093 [Leucosporidium creatinivorum]
MDPAEHLPVELLRWIIELAAAATTDDRRWRRLAKLNTLFRSLALVNHAWEEVSLPFLYANITLDAREQEQQAKSLMRTLDRHPTAPRCSVTLPQDINSFSKSFPNVSELSVHFAGDFRQETEVRESPLLQFVLAMAPQLVTVRLRYGTNGVPISFIRHLISIAPLLRRLDSTVIFSYHSHSTSPLAPTLLDFADLPPLELRFIFHSASSKHRRLTEALPLEERLWALFESRDDGAVAAISALHRVERIVLEPWLVERFPEGVDYAVGKIRQRGLRLEIDSPDSFYIDE